MPFNNDENSNRIQENLQELAILINQTTRGVIAFALYNTLNDRRYAVNELRKRIKLDIVEIHLSQNMPTPMYELVDPRHNDRVCIMYYDIEEALPTVAKICNIQRERFSEYPHVTIFWVGEYGLREFMEQAPDFFAWRSGTFDFRNEEMELPGLEDMQSAVFERIHFKDKEDLERKKSLYIGLLKDYEKADVKDYRYLAKLSQKLCYIFINTMEFLNALKYGQKALAYAEKTADDYVKAESFTMLGIVYRKNENYKKSIELLRKALEIFKNTNRQKETAICLFELGVAEYKNGDQETGEELVKDAYNISKNYEPDILSAVIFEQFGRFEFLKGNHFKAEEYFGKSLSVYRKISDEEGVAGIYNLLASIDFTKHDFPQALKKIKFAIEIYDRLELEYKLAKNYAFIGLIYYNLSDFQSSLEYTKKALKIYKKIKDNLNVFACLIQLSIIDQELNNLDNSVKYFGEAYYLNKKFGFKDIDFFKNSIKKLISKVGYQQIIQIWQKHFTHLPSFLEQATETEAAAKA